MAYPGVAPTWRLPRARTPFNGGASMPRPRAQPWGGGRQGLGTRIFNAGKAAQGTARPLAPRNGGASAPAAPGNGGASPPAAPDPLDAQYYNQIARNQASVDQRTAALNAQGANQRTALGEYLRQLGLREPTTEQNSTNRANNQGLLYSGALGRQIGDLQTAYVQNQSGANQRFAQAEAARQAQISGMQQQQGFDELTARIAAIQRSSQAAQNAPLIQAPGNSPAAGGPGIVPSVGKIGPGRPRTATVRPWGGGAQGLGRRIYNAGQRARR